MSDRKVKPSALFYVLGGAIILTGVVVPIVISMSYIFDLIDSFTQLVIPGTSEIELSEIGAYTIYHEYNSVFDGKVYRTEGDIANLQCTLTSKETGAQIPLSSPFGSSTYSMGSRKGCSLFKFSIDRPGTYVFSASYPEDSGGPEAVFAIERSDKVFKLLKLIFGTVAIGFGSFIGGGLIIVLTALKRYKAQKRHGYA